jgi:hypothetical protein
MFKFVYPSVLGRQEFVISVENLRDSEDYVKELIGELTKVMSHESTDLEFSDPVLARAEMNNPDWQPFTCATNKIATKIDTCTNTTNFSEQDHYQNPAPKYNMKITNPTITRCTSNNNVYTKYTTKEPISSTYRETH